MAESKPLQARAWSFETDLDEILEGAETVWPRLKGANLFITGGTGFVGRWLLEALRRADRSLGLGLQATVLTRYPAAFAEKAPGLAAYPGFSFQAGDVTTFAPPPAAYTHLIHAATDASAHLNEHFPATMFDTVVLGTRRALDIAVQRKIPRVLFLSSGAVYGPQPWEMERVPETWPGVLDCTDPRATYGEAKRAAEMLCAIYRKQYSLNVSTARIFAVLGPHLPLDIHFAAGNFIRDAIAGRPVVVQSAGLGCRSYLYATDLIVWLLHVLTHGRDGAAYNVGSEEWVSIRDLAERTAKLLARGEFEVLGQADSGWNPGRYVPATQLAELELGVRRTVGLDEAITRTAIWNGWDNGQG